MRRKTTRMGRALSTIVALGLWATASIAAPTLSEPHGPFSYDGGFVPDRKEIIGVLYHLNGRFETAFGDAITIKHHFTSRLGKRNWTFQGEWNYTQFAPSALVFGGKRNCHREYSRLQSRCFLREFYPGGRGSVSIRTRLYPGASSSRSPL